MSGYASKDELLDVIRRTITTNYAGQGAEGLPLEVEAYNMAGVCRDLGVSGGNGYGWRYDYAAPPLLEILRANVRKGWAA